MSTQDGGWQTLALGTCGQTYEPMSGWARALAHPRRNSPGCAGCCAGEGGACKHGLAWICL